jgi:hypothetical protein
MQTRCNCHQAELSGSRVRPMMIELTVEKPQIYDEFFAGGIRQ